MYVCMYIYAWGSILYLCIFLAIKYCHMKKILIKTLEVAVRTEKRRKRRRRMLSIRFM